MEEETTRQDEEKMQGGDKPGWVCGIGEHLEENGDHGDPGQTAGMFGSRAWDALKGDDKRPEEKGQGEQADQRGIHDFCRKEVGGSQHEARSEKGEAEPVFGVAKCLGGEGRCRRSCGDVLSSRRVIVAVVALTAVAEVGKANECDKSERPKAELRGQIEPRFEDERK